MSQETLSPAEARKGPWGQSPAGRQGPGSVLSKGAPEQVPRLFSLRLLPSRSKLLFVDGAGEDLGELAQLLVGGLGLLLQPLVALPERGHFRLQHHLVLLFLQRPRRSRESQATQSPVPPSQPRPSPWGFCQAPPAPYFLQVTVQLLQHRFQVGDLSCQIRRQLLLAARADRSGCDAKPTRGSWRGSDRGSPAQAVQNEGHTPTPQARGGGEG